ncbi:MULTISPECIES: hypothetical protein [Nostocales]|jgi:hypothetical protein|uniref:Uncharacterized protein n=1 Tax=Aphanizomenon flos-aquae FACHB-1040 TaxID=2692887 RepID=A0ABR8C3X7_APHFL|nr:MULTISPECIES: hypothetical protein [Nostocales]ALB43340.1 hypothetical protein AA650_25375 [Anabaena sp. WA102]MBD2281475.1 hypothetical protein [Aphanizomenon flos-aquae FACHB-1040]
MKKLNWRNYIIATLTTIVSNPILYVAAQEIPKGQCITNNFGQQLCGYNCVQNQFGQMKCADWPGGVCTVNNFGQITCGPPAPHHWNLRYTSPSQTANPPDIKWRIVRHNMSLQECQQRAYQSLETANFINLKTGVNSNSGYMIQGDINNNRAKISCLNDIVLIIVAGDEPKTLKRLHDSIYQNMGFR